MSGSIPSAWTIVETSTCRAPGAAAADGTAPPVSPGQRVERLARDPVLLADTDRAQPSVAHVAPDGADVEPQSFRHLIDREKLASSWNVPFMNLLIL